MKETKTLVAIGILFAVILGGFFINEGSKPKTEEEVRVAFSPEEYPTASLLEFAEEKGIFKKNGISIKRKPNARNIAATLQSGDVDITMNPTGSSLTAYLNGQDVVWIQKLTNYPPQTGLFSKLSKEDLSKAKKATVSRLGGVYHIYTEVVAPSFGIKSLDYSIAPAGPSQSVLLEKGETDLILVDYTDEEIIKFGKEKGFNVIESKELFKENYAPLGIYTTNKVITEKRPRVAAFVKSISAIKKYIKRNPDEYKNFLREKYHLTEQALEVTYEGIMETTADDKPEVSDIKQINEAVRKIAEPSQPNRDLGQFISTEFLPGLF